MYSLHCMSYTYSNWGNKSRKERIVLLGQARTLEGIKSIHLNQKHRDYTVGTMSNKAHKPE